MRIAEIAPPWLSIPPTGYGGIEMIVDRLVHGLHELGHELTLFAPEGSEARATVVSPLEPAGASEIGDPGSRPSTPSPPTCVGTSSILCTTTR